MYSQLTQHALDVMAYGLALRDRVIAGDPVVLLTEQAKLKAMLLADEPVRTDPEYADIAARPVPVDYREFLGIRYALTCWLDELFAGDPAGRWAADWRKSLLETDLYGDGHRAWRFWQQAELAEKRDTNEPMEVYFWAAALGFRGAPTRIDPAAWVARARRTVQTAKQQDFFQPADARPTADARPLTGRRLLAVAARALLGVVVLLAVLSLALLLRTPPVGE